MAAVDEHAVFEEGPVVIFRWRNAAGWPVEYVSSNALDVLGYPAADFLSGAVSYAGLIAPEDIERVSSEVSNAAESGARSFAHAPYRVRRRDGSLRWLYDFTHVVRDAQGRATHFVGYVFDVTHHAQAEAERQELERRLLHAQKLESLGVLAGGVAHDFNNLLTGVLGQVSLLRRELDRSQPDLRRVRAGIEQIEGISLRAADLTRQLLAYSGKGSMVVEPVDLGALIDEMTGILAALLSKKATVERRLDPACPRVNADRAQLQQVVMNLLTNASDALGDAPGRIVVRTGHGRFTREELAERFEDEGLPGGEYVTLDVEDDGCGMNDEAQRRLFEPFYTTKFAGRGLGLSAVLGIVRGHRGAVRVRSKAGAGTVFSLVFPASASALERRESVAPELGWRADGTVLVVDDEPFVRRTLRLLLESFGFAVVEASNGAEALERFEAERARIALVLMDMTMPELSGLEALRALRAIDANVPVVLSSGYSDEALMLGADDPQPTAFLQKPYRVEDLERVLQAIVPPRPRG